MRRKIRCPDTIESQTFVEFLILRTIIQISFDIDITSYFVSRAVLSTRTCDNILRFRGRWERKMRSISANIEIISKDAIITIKISTNASSSIGTHTRTRHNDVTRNNQIAFSVKRVRSLKISINHHGIDMRMPFCMCRSTIIIEFEINMFLCDLSRNRHAVQTVYI